MIVLRALMIGCIVAYLITPIYTITWSFRRTGKHAAPGVICLMVWITSLLLTITTAPPVYSEGSPAIAKEIYDALLYICSFVVLPIGAFAYLRFLGRTQ